MEKAVKDQLHTYYTEGYPCSYSTVERLQKYYNSRHSPKLTRTDVKNFLETKDAYTLHQTAFRKLKCPPRVKVWDIDEQWEADLCDMSSVAPHNKDVRYILTVIDVLSKFAWTQPVLTKTGSVVKKAFSDILARSSRKPKRLHTDKGSEFYNRQFSSYLKLKKIDHFSRQSVNKACTAERFNRTLKSLIYKHFTSTGQFEWLNTLEKLTRVYNTRYHRSIKMAPVKAVKGLTPLLLKNVYGKTCSGLKNRKFDIGDFVRISKVKQRFEKGYLPSFSEEVFKVAAIHRGQPTRYSLHDLLNEEIEGKFSPQELTLIRNVPENIWRVEKVLKQSKGKYLVKWSGFPENFNSWVSTEDMVL